MATAWMPLYVGDLMADTQHLSPAEFGAYLLLICHYWQKGSLPDNDRQLARVARMTAAEWKEIRPVLATFFGRKWRHKRIDEELQKKAVSYRRRAAAGRKGGMAKSSNATAMLQQCSSNHTHTHKKEDIQLPLISDAEKRELVLQYQNLDIDYEIKKVSEWCITKGIVDNEACRRIIYKKLADKATARSVDQQHVPPPSAEAIDALKRRRRK